MESAAVVAHFLYIAFHQDRNVRATQPGTVCLTLSKWLHLHIAGGCLVVVGLFPHLLANRHADYVITNTTYNCVRYIVEAQTVYICVLDRIVGIVHVTVVCCAADAER